MSLDLLLLSACLSFSVDVPLVIYVLSVERRRKWNDLEDLAIAAFIVYVYISTAAEGSGTSLWNMFEINLISPQFLPTLRIVCVDVNRPSLFDFLAKVLV